MPKGELGRRLEAGVHSGAQGGEYGHELNSREPACTRLRPGVGVASPIALRRMAAHGRRDGARREATEPQVTGLFHRRPSTEGGGSCAQIMVRAQRNDPSRVVSLDERDDAILLTLLEHKVLSTDQIKNLFFRSFRRCQHRMKELRDLGFVSSFTPGRGFGKGRPPACFILTKLGLAEIAKAKGVRISDLPWIPDHSYRGSHMLAHRLGVNAFFGALAEASRAHEGHCLHTWRPEHWVRTRAAEVKPDGFGRYLHPGGACEFYLEYDRGTEAFGALSRKLQGYLRLAAGWTKEEELVGFPNLLLIVPEGVREGEVGSALRQAIGIVQVRRSLGTSFPLYVAGEDRLTELGVLGPTWRHLPTDGDRVSLLDLPVRPPDLYRTARCLGRYFTDAEPGYWRRISPASTTPRFRALPPRHAP